VSEQARIFKKLFQLSEDKKTVEDCIKATANNEAKQIYIATLRYIERKHSNLLTELYLVEDKVEEKYAK